ncbi:RNF213 [Mytilus coruscus]|uniref:RNF213 n=1 Tax=Mytilus coruscus TaxID=42192 RepID=A0A6J8BJ77_MYTCO|nr:RNF213 [Mytilus coruscus]
MLFEAAGNLCEQCKSPWPRRYFVKQLCRRFGIESYQKVLKEKHEEYLKWTELPELVTEKVEECHDRYIVCGDDYKQFREGITQAIMIANGDNLKSVIQTSRRDWKSTIKILLAVHREVTMKNVYKIEEHVPKEKKDVVKECIYEQFPHVQQLTDVLLDNNLWSADASKNIQEGMDLSGQNTVCLLTHFWLMISQIPGKTCVIAPLKKIATEPDKMMEAFFPTMPHDEKFELLQHLRQMTETDGSNFSLKYYRCPNGHIYVIGDCGRPWVKAKCNECGADIGGQRHNASEGNAALEISYDTTAPGHILGAPTARDTRNVAVERKLAGVSLPLVRLLLHMSMFVGSNINLQAVTRTIKNPEIQEDEVASFLLQHISADLETMQNVLGKNKDDVFLLVHQFLFVLTELHTANVIADNKPEDYCVLKTKDNRELWENEFTQLYVEPMKQNMEEALNENNSKIIEDKRLGADPLLQLLYETEDSHQEADITKLYDNPAVWRYREQISIPNLRRVLSNSESDYPVLLLFLKEEHHLRAIRFIPSILRLQKMLIQRYNRKLEKSETYLIRGVKHDMKIDGKQDEFLQLLYDFKEAWKTVCQSLENYACHTKTATVQLDLQYCRTSIDDKTPLSLLLPTHKGIGLCSYMMVAFLLEKQNQFMEQYCKWNKISIEHLPTVQVNDISSAHLISYHPDKDLLPLLLANCNYTFEMGKGTKIEYNYRDLERQIMDRFLFSKSRITNIKEIETFTYRAEFTSSGVFQDLIKIVKQERLHSAIQAQISEELSKKSYPDLCQGLDALDIAISFLKSVKTDPDLSLHEFMTRTLKIESPLPSYKAQQAAKCKHTMSLWMTMAIERTKCQARYDKGTFDGTSDFLKIQLSDDQTNAVKEALNGLQIEQTSLLLEVLYELIILMLDVPMGTGDDYVDISAMSMKDSIIGYIGASLFEEDPQKEDILTEIVYLMFPENIISSQAVEVWNLTNEILMDKLYAKK